MSTTTKPKAAKAISTTTEPAVARRLITAIKRVNGDDLRDLLAQVDAWTATAEHHQQDLVRRVNDGEARLKQAVRAWDKVLPDLRRATARARQRMERTGVQQPTTADDAQGKEDQQANGGGQEGKPTIDPAPATTGLSGLDAAARVLGEASEPLRCAEIVRRMLEQGLWSTTGRTPAATINAAIIREIATKGDQSRFRKTGRGLFARA